MKISVINSNIGNSLWAGQSLQASCKLEVAYSPMSNNYKESTMEKKYNFVYQTTNLVNGKIYIGVHSTNNLDDGYIGSGFKLIRSKNHYGEENFKREIIEFFETKDEAYKMEEELVTPEFILRDDVYNLVPGGSGGYKNISDEGKQRISDARKDTVVALCYGKVISVTKEEFDSRDDLVGHTVGYVTVTDGETFFQVSVDDERYKNGELSPPSKDLVVAINKITGERVTVLKDEFDIDDELVGNTFGSKQTKESNLKRSQTLKGIDTNGSFTRKVNCPHCDKSGSFANMKRWHYDNCKFKETV